MKKTLYIHEKAKEEIESFSKTTQKLIDIQILVLKQEGRLTPPHGKKLTSFKYLYEIRIKDKNQIRVLYSYQHRNEIFILLAFVKKTQKTPTKHIKLALKRLNKMLS